MLLPLNGVFGLLMIALMCELMALKILYIWVLYIPFVGYVEEERERGEEREGEGELIMKGIQGKSSCSIVR